MQFGVSMVPTDQTITPMELARAAEDLGFESLFFAEHTHIPVVMRQQYQGVGGILPPAFRRSLDPFAAMTAAAVVTSRIKVATGICLVVQRDPITTAKEVATVDYLSGGRVLFGIGAGWNEVEIANHGVDPSTRFRLLRERVEAMQAIWTQDEAAYHGQLVNFDPIQSWPKPVQRPHPPIILAGNGPSVLRRVVQYADGWWPFSNTYDTLAGRIAELQRLAAEAGRPPLPVTLMTQPFDAATLERMAAAGVARCILRVPSGPASEVRPALAERAAVMKAFLE